MKQEKTGRKILVRPSNSLPLTSLSWESLKGVLLVSLKTISMNVFKWHNPTISKGCWHIFNASKVMMSWDKLCNYFRCVQRSVYASRYWFLFQKNFKSYSVYSVVHQATFYQPNATSFYYFLQIRAFLFPDRTPSDSGSESTTEYEEESEVSWERLGKLCCCKLCNCYHVSVKKSVLLDSLVLSGTIIIS